VRRSSLLALALALGLAIAPSGLSGRAQAIASCGLQYVIVPYLDGDGHVASSARAVCNQPTTVWVEDQIQRWLPGPGGGDWLVVADHVSQCNNTCTSVVSVAQRTCATTTSSVYFARARFFGPFGWSGWTSSAQVHLDCR